MAGKKGCGGKKGRSGRKSKRNEAIVSETINLCWSEFLKELKDVAVPREEKRKFWLEICKKSCPQDVNLGGNINFKLINHIQSPESEND